MFFKMVKSPLQPTQLLILPLSLSLKTTSPTILTHVPCTECLVINELCPCSFPISCVSACAMSRISFPSCLLVNYKQTRDILGFS